MAVEEAEAEAAPVEAVAAHTITMAGMDTETVMEIIATQVRGAVHRVGLQVESSAVYSAAYSVLSSARMERAKDVVKPKEKGRSIQIRSETMMALKTTEMIAKAPGRAITVTYSNLIQTRQSIISMTLCNNQQRWVKIRMEIPK